MHVACVIIMRLAHVSYEMKLAQHAQLMSCVEASKTCTYMLHVLHEVAAHAWSDDDLHVDLQRLLWCEPVRELLQGRVRNWQGFT